MESRIKSSLCTVILVGICITVCDTSEIALQEYLRFNYTLHTDPMCLSPIGARNPCSDIRICSFAVASLAMGGWPTTCGLVGKGVPKVCCGLPLVLGPRLIKKVDEEKARNRRCGTIIFEPNLSETERVYRQILNSLPVIDIRSDLEKFDPPIVFPEPMWSPVGGKPSRQEDFPWMVSIRRKGSHWCGGSLIDRKHILSAAHCFVDEGVKQDPADFTVHVGNIYVDEGHPFNVVKIVLHPRYHPLYHDYDIAMMTLGEEILTPMIAHICLPSPELIAQDLTGRNTTLLGWGDTSFGGKGTATLHIVDNLPIVSHSECRMAYRQVGADQLPYGLTEDFICAGEDEGGRDACQQDSGGPLMYKYNPQNLPDDDSSIPYVLVGVVSFGFLCGEPGFPGVYTRVSSHMEWITKTMNQ